MLDVLCGVALLAVGYWIGRRQKAEPEPMRLTEEELKAEQKAKERWELLLNFNGKGGLRDE